MSTQEEERVYYLPAKAERPSRAYQGAFAILLVIAGIVAALVILRVVDTRMPAVPAARATAAPAALPTIPAPPQNLGNAPLIPTAHIPVVSVEQYQPAPPADVPIEEMQERAPVVVVDRAPEAVTITRTIPQRPAGAPIVVDGGEKRRGAPKP